MDGFRFDALTRRQAGLGLSGFVAGLLGAAAGQGAAARKKKPKKKSSCSKKQKQKCRRQDRVCENGTCIVNCNAGNSVCRGNNIIQLCGSAQESCDCSPLAAGGFACAAARPEICPGASQCARDAQCAAGEVCVDVSGDECCGGQTFGLCRKRCRSGNIGN